MKSPAKAVFSIKAALYPLQAVYAACYMFIDRAYLYLDMDAEGNIVVTLRGKPDAAKSLDHIEGEFHNELLHQALRIKISEGNQKIREHIVTQALFSAQPSAAEPASAIPEK